MFFKIVALKNFSNFTRKHYWWSLFLTKLQAWACNFIKKRLQHRGFPLNFVNVLGTPSSTEHLRVAASEQTQEISVVYVAKRFFGHLA